MKKILAILGLIAGVGLVSIAASNMAPQLDIATQSGSAEALNLDALVSTGQDSDRRLIYVDNGKLTTERPATKMCAPGQYCEDDEKCCFIAGSQVVCCGADESCGDDVEEPCK